MRPTIDELVIADAPAAWRAVGFDVDGDVSTVASVRLRFEGAGVRRGIVGWSVRGARSLDLDGLVTTASDEPPAAGGPHPNGVVAIDHVVAMTPHLDRTAGVLRDAGFDFRRLREGPTPGGSTRQAFFRMGAVILEVVQAPAAVSVAHTRLWGISFVVEQLDATAAVLGTLLGSLRDAVQPGRRIATLSSEARLGPAIAFMTPGPGAA